MGEINLRSALNRGGVATKAHPGTPPKTGADLFWDFFSFLGGHFFFWSVGFVPAFFPAHVVWLGGVFAVVWWCFCGGVFVVVFVW